MLGRCCEQSHTVQGKTQITSTQGAAGGKRCCRHPLVLVVVVVQVLYSWGGPACLLPFLWSAWRGVFLGCADALFTVSAPCVCACPQFLGHPSSNALDTLSAQLAQLQQQQQQQQQNAVAAALASQQRPSASAMSAQTSNASVMALLGKVREAAVAGAGEGRGQNTEGEGTHCRGRGKVCVRQGEGGVYGKGWVRVRGQHRRGERAHAGRRRLAYT